MSMRCGLDIFSSREAALTDRTRIWIFPGQVEAVVERPVEEFFAKNALPLLWVPLFGAGDVVTLRPPSGARYKFTERFDPIPMPVLLSPVDVALDRLERQSVRLLSFLDLNPVRPNVSAFVEVWQARLRRHAGKWVIFDPGDVVPFEADDLAIWLGATLKAIAGDTPDASLLSTIRDAFGSPFTYHYSSSAREIAEVWYHDLAGSLDGAETGWPPEPTTADLAAAEVAAEIAVAAKAAKEIPVAKKPAVKWWQRFLTRS